MATFRDFLPPILARALWRGGAGAEAKEMSGSIDFLPGIAEFMNPSEPTYKTARDYGKMSQHGYNGNVYLYRAVTVITQAIAGIPWELYKKGRGGQRASIPHPVIDLLNIEANDDDSGPEFMEAVCAYWLLAGMTYVWAVRPETGATRAPTKLYPIQPNCMTPDVDRDGALTGWTFQVGDHKQHFNPEDILRVKDFHPLTRAQGVAPASVAARALDQHNAANDWNTALLQNMARPSGMLTPKFDSIIPPDAHATFKEDLRERYQGPRNAGRPLVPRAPMEWTEMGQTPSEMDWLNGKTQAAREIAIAFGVPPELLGDASNKTYSNQVEARRALYMETILPRMDRLKAALSRWLLPMYGLDPAVYAIDYDRNAIEALAEDQDAMHARARQDYIGGIITLNQARTMIGEDPIDEGDIFLAPPRALTLDQLLEGASLPTLPDGAKPPTPPHPGAPATPPALPPGQIVDANPPGNGGNTSPNAASGPSVASNGAKGMDRQVMPPFASRAAHALYSPSARAKRLAKEAREAAAVTARRR